MLAVQRGGRGWGVYIVSPYSHWMATDLEKKNNNNAGGAPERVAPQREVSPELRLEVKTVREWR